MWLQNPWRAPTPAGRRAAARACTRAALVAGVLCGAGCATLPDTQFLKRRYTSQAAEISSAWGPLSERESAAILAGLKRTAGNLDILDRQVALEQAVAGQPLVVGNHVTLLQDGPATYQAMFAAIRQARHTVNVESFIIEDGPVGRQFADLLLARRAAGVEVNVLYDSYGALGTSRAFFDRLRRGGIRVVEFNPLNPLAARRRWAPNHRDHRKLLVVDGRTAFLGGINIDSYHSSGLPGTAPGTGGSGSAPRGRRIGWRDTDVQIDGPVVADFQRFFLQTWAKQHGPPLRVSDYLPPIAPCGTDIVRAIASSPDDTFSAMYLTLIAAVTNARKSVDITNAYFVPDPQLVQALLDAARRGVDVRLILPSATDSPSTYYSAHSHYTELLRGGVKIYERRVTILHAKTAVIDGVWSCVGSSNLDWRSALDNDEINAVILGTDFAKQMARAYALDEAASDEIRLPQWQHRPWHDRIREWFFRLVGRLI